MSLESNQHFMIKDWNLNNALRFYLGFFITVPILLSLFLDFDGTGNYFNYLDATYVQEFLIYSIFAISFGAGFFVRQYRGWFLFLGLGTVGIGTSIFVQYMITFEDSTASFNGNVMWFLAGVLPFFASILALIVVWRDQDVNLESNNRTQRISAVFGFILALLLILGEFLPWIRDTYQATSKDWTFKGSGTQLLVEECCYLTDLGLSLSIKILAPFVWLAILFGLQMMGHRILFVSFVPSIIWAAQEVIDFLTGLGIREPLNTWNANEVERFGLSHESTGLFGGYLFTVSTILFVIVLAIPRVVDGKPERNITEEEKTL